MEYLDLLKEIFEVCIVPLLGVLTAYLIKWINKKAKELDAQTDSVLVSKYIAMLDTTITAAVAATTQTYVDTMKGKDLFDESAQKIAFQTTFNAVKNQLTSESLTYLTEVYGDLEAYIESRIEAEVKFQK